MGCGPVDWVGKVLPEAKFEEEKNMDRSIDLAVQHMQTNFSRSSEKKSEMEKRYNKIAQTQFLDLRNSTKTLNSRHIIIHAKTA